MRLEDVSRQLDGLYRTHAFGGQIRIGTHIHFEGEPMDFLFRQEDDKYSRVYTDRNFSEWIAWCTGSWKAAEPIITKLANLYGVQWDNEDGVLFLRFRRNELSLAQAVLRLEQAVFVIGALETVI